MCQCDPEHLPEVTAAHGKSWCMHQHDDADGYLCADLKQDVRMIMCKNALGLHGAVVVWLTHQDRR